MTRELIGSRAADVLIVGGGHAGCEAALACARLGKDTLLVTGSIERIAAMSCNPAIGGVGKGHLVKELDALGGEMGRAADDTGIHFRTLNESRGPAVRATRCQSDMDRYAADVRRVVARTANLRVRQDDVVELVVDDGRVTGVRTKTGELLRARRVILTTGTFLGGLLHRGADRSAGGRAGEAPAHGLSSSLAAHGLTLGRLKTGTCPRLDGRTIRNDVLDEQRPDSPAPHFSFDHADRLAPPLPQVSCRLTRTTAATHEVIRAAVSEGSSPLFNGQIGGRGPRYCPSVEDKVVRFAEKDTHLVFLEPHGLDTHEVYPNGLSTSLPPHVQLAFLRTMPGLEDVEVTRWGYAVEYDFVDPTQLAHSLETKSIEGLYCAGQLNGTTGYEEAAMQGLLAGINAARSLDDKAPVVLRRDQAYAGVLVDDLVLKGTDEPYRMFTSRAEHRLLLREDNVSTRLLEISAEVGLASATRTARMRAFEDDVTATLAHFAATKVNPTPAVNALLATAGGAALREPATLLALLRRSEVDGALLLALAAHTRPNDDAAGAHPHTTDAVIDAIEVHARTADASLGLASGTRGDRASTGGAHDVPLASTLPDLRVLARVEVEVKYAGYIERAEKDLVRDRALEDEALPDDIFGARLPGISNEVHEKLLRLRPRTLGQASRISGMTPAAVGLLAVEMRRRSS